MHNRHIFIMKSDTAENAMTTLEHEFYNDESLTSDNWFRVIGALDIKNNKWIKNPDEDTDRDEERLHTVEGMNKALNDISSKERVAKLERELLEKVKKKQYFEVADLANQLDGIQGASEKGVDIRKEIIEINPYDKFTFGLSNYDFLAFNEEDTELFAVVVDFHS